MTNRFKIIAAALVIVTGAISGVVAKTAAPVPAAVHGVASKPVANKIATSRHHHIRVARRDTKNLKVTHRATSRGKIAHELGRKRIAKVGTAGRPTVIR